jgi:catechol O-methyltransferase
MVLTAVQYTAEQGNPQSVLDAIDAFAEYYRRIMIIGQDKGGKIDAVLLKHKPKVMYELGCFVGYSAVRFGALLRQWGGKYYSFEIDAQSVEVSRKIVEIAGLQDTVEVRTMQSGVIRRRNGIDTNFILFYCLLDHSWRL